MKNWLATRLHLIKLWLECFIFVNRSKNQCALYYQPDKGSLLRWFGHSGKVLDSHENQCMLALSLVLTDDSDMSYYIRQSLLAYLGHAVLEGRVPFLRAAVTTDDPNEPVER